MTRVWEIAQPFVIDGNKWNEISAKYFELY